MVKYKFNIETEVHNFFNNDRKRKYESLFIYIRLIILEECAHLFQKKSLKITKETSGGMEIVFDTSLRKQIQIT